MHFIDNKKVAKSILLKLRKFHDKYQPKWDAYIKNNGDKPNDNKWIDTEIRQALSDVFACNCGYCGVYIQFDINNINIETDGELDHYFPICSNSNEVYNWYNYIWSCHSCNHKKSDYFHYNIELSILNPTKLDDCIYLRFYEGRYNISDKSPNKSELDNRLRITEDNTSIHWQSKVDQRFVYYTDIITLVKSILTEKFKAEYNIKNTYNVDLENFKRKITKSSFKLLFRDHIYPEIKRKHPEFPLELKDFNL